MVTYSLPSTNNILQLEKLSDKLEGELAEQSNSLGLKITRFLGPLKNRVDHLDKRVDALGKMRVKDGEESEEVMEEEEMEEEERMETPPISLVRNPVYFK